MPILTPIPSPDKNIIHYLYVCNEPRFDGCLVHGKRHFVYRQTYHPPTADLYVWK